MKSAKKYFLGGLNLHVKGKYIILLLSAAFVSGFFQNCAKGSFEGGAIDAQLASLSNFNCTPSQNFQCLGANGMGNQFCQQDGKTLSACLLSSCDAGFHLSGGTCIGNSCTPGSTASCSGTHGSGTKSCLSSGAAWDTCTLDSCNSGYNLQGGLCVQNSCTPNNNIGCTANHGSGNKICNSSGSGYGACSLSSCDSGYHFDSAGVCVSNTCTPKSITACLNAENTGSGQKTCNDQGSGYGSCTLDSCNTGYYLDSLSGNCIAYFCTPSSTAACTSVAQHGAGNKTCNLAGLAYGPCVIETCDSGYYMDISKSCVAVACSPNSVARCSDLNSTGTGNKTCNSVGSGYGSCTLDTCNTGYHWDNGICAMNSCAPSASETCSNASGSGTRTCAIDGSAWGVCQFSTCNSGYHIDASSTCVINSCNPNVDTMNCTDSSGVGTGFQTCNSAGSGYGSCVLNSCPTNYNLSGGVCVAISTVTTVSNLSVSATYSSSSISLVSSLNTPNIPSSVAFSINGTSLTFDVNVANNSGYSVSVSRSKSSCDPTKGSCLTNLSTSSGSTLNLSAVGGTATLTNLSSGKNYLIVIQLSKSGATTISYQFIIKVP